MKERKMTSEELAVIQLLENAKPKGLTRKQIIARLGREQSYKRQLNEIIANLIIKHGYLIGSTRDKGYFMCETIDDVERAIYTLTSQYRGLNMRVNALRRGRDKLQYR